MSKQSKRDRQLQRQISQYQNQIQPQASRALITQRQELRIAPLPRADELAHFDAVLPGLAERIVRMAEENGVDRRRNNRTIRVATIMGPIFAFIVAMTALGGGLYLVAQGKDVAGIAAIITAIGVPLGVFVYQRARS